MPPGADEPVSELPALRDGELLLRPAGGGDLAAIAAVLADPEVARWWGAYTEQEIVEELDPSWVWVVCERDRIVGWLQADEETAPNYPSVAFDIALGVSARGRGLGRRALWLALRHFVAAGHHRFTIDPALDNVVAIRAYRAVGFRDVGVLRRYERAPDGSWRDGLLMELLAEELTG